MRVHRDADLDRELDGLHDQLVALQLHLPARHVERGDDLLVGRGRGVGEDRLLEGLLVPVVVLVGHQHHRALPQRTTSTCASSWSGRRAAWPCADRG